jgi:hypothetical protein
MGISQMNDDSFTMEYVKDAESAFGQRNVFNSTSGTPNANQMDATGGCRNIWIP